MITYGNPRGLVEAVLTESLCEFLSHLLVNRDVVHETSQFLTSRELTQQLRTHSGFGDHDFLRVNSSTEVLIGEGVRLRREEALQHTFERQTSTAILRREGNYNHSEHDVHTYTVIDHNIQRQILDVPWWTRSAWHLYQLVRRETSIQTHNAL